MMSFRDGFLTRFALPTGTAWLLGDVAEAKGRQVLYARGAPRMLGTLREEALVRSVESSNRIEGVTVAPGRLRPLVLGGARPRTRPEEEIRGYRRALARIHEDPGGLRVTPEFLRWCHRTLLEGAGDAGQWKRADNEIVELRKGAPPVVRFRPVPARATPGAVEELCGLYRRSVEQERVPPLLAVAALTLDFLCIHPFRDGNGRVSRLLTLLALYHHGYEVGRYVSLEREVEASREDYYDVLRRSSRGWHEGRHDLGPWLGYFTSVLRRAYRDFEEKAARLKAPRGAKRALVEAAAAAFPGDFMLKALEAECPGVSPDMVRRVLRDLKQAGRVKCLSRGPGARWRKK